MRVCLTGATGAVGRRLIPMLIARGHQITALTRSPDKVNWLRRQGAEAIVAHGLDRDAVLRAVSVARPEILIHHMTGLAEAKSLKRFDKEFAQTNRLRTEGTDYLIEAARAVKARRLITQSYGNWNYERTGTEPKKESAPFDANPPTHQRRSLSAIRHCEAATLGTPGLEGFALRFGNFYGPGTGFSPDGDLVKLVRNRQLPIIGDGAGVWSFVHIDDAAMATVAAMTCSSPASTTSSMMSPHR